jgi:membrane-associated phospholipid phosphatase
VVEDFCSMVYGTHFLLPIAVGAWLWVCHRHAFQRFGMTLVVLCALAFATYVAAPTSPPWLAQPQSVQHLISIAIARSGLPSSLTWLYAHHDYNLYAAFPSLHAGFPVVAAVAAWEVNRRVGILLGLWALVVWVSVIYLGEHYVADIVGGTVYAAAAILIVSHLNARRAASRSRAAA